VLSRQSLTGFNSETALYVANYTHHKCAVKYPSVLEVSHCLYANVVTRPYSVPFAVETETSTDQIHILIISALVLHFFQDSLKISVMHYLKTTSSNLPTNKLIRRFE